jgi:ankyrin repeat protein
MKIFLTFVTLLWAFSAPLFAQSAEPKQTPDVIDDAEVTQVPEPPTEAPKPLSQRDNALIQSAYDGKLADVEILVAKGAAVNLQDKKKRTPLILAASNGHTSVVEFLISKGAEVNAKDSGGESALMYASKRSFNETAAFLLKHGAEVNLQSKKKGITALMLAAVWGNVELVQMLLEHGADANLTDTFGRTAKLLAQKKGNSAVVDLLPDPPAPENEQ